MAQTEGDNTVDKLMLFLANSDLNEVMQNIKLQGALGGVSFYFFRDKKNNNNQKNFPKLNH